MTEMTCDGFRAISNMSAISCAQWVHLFSVDFDNFSTIFLIILVLKLILDGKIIALWVHHIPAITCDKGIGCFSTRIELIYLDDNFRPIALWVLASHIIV